MALFSLSLSASLFIFASFFMPLLLLRSVGKVVFLTPQRRRFNGRPQNVGNEKNVSAIKHLVCVAVKQSKAVATAPKHVKKLSASFIYYQ